VRENQSFVPELLGQAYGKQYPDALRDILVENGTLRPDYTPNEATANRLGWTLREEPAPSVARPLPRVVREDARFPGVGQER